MANLLSVLCLVLLVLVLPEAQANANWDAIQHCPYDQLAPPRREQLNHQQEAQCTDCSKTLQRKGPSPVYTGNS